MVVIFHLENRLNQLPYKKGRANLLVSRTGIFHALFRLIFLTKLRPLSFKLDLIILATLVQTHFACLLGSQINGKRVY